MHTYHNRNVDCCQEVNLRIARRHIPQKYKTFWIQGKNLGAILQKRYIFSWPIFPGRVRPMRVKEGNVTSTYVINPVCSTEERLLLFMFMQHRPWQSANVLHWNLDSNLDALGSHNKDEWHFSRTNKGNWYSLNLHPSKSLYVNVNFQIISVHLNLKARFEFISSHFSSGTYMHESWFKKNVTQTPMKHLHYGLSLTKLTCKNTKIPVSVWPYLSNWRLSTRNNNIRIGDVEEIILHVHWWRWVYPRI